MQGISRNRPLLCENRLEYISEFNDLRVDSLRIQSREFFCQRRELIARAGMSTEFRAKPTRSPRRIRLGQRGFSFTDKKIINYCDMLSMPNERALLLRTD